MTYLRIRGADRTLVPLPERWREDAEEKARIDRRMGRGCDPTRHGAKPGSAWAVWYIDGYATAAGY